VTLVRVLAGLLPRLKMRAPWKANSAKSKRGNELTDMAAG